MLCDVEVKFFYGASWTYYQQIAFLRYSNSRANYCTSNKTKTRNLCIDFVLYQFVFYFLCLMYVYIYLLVLLLLLLFFD
jgi:hypothetical protein